MNILLITDYFPPEITACAFRAYPNALAWAKMGHQVTVLTSVPNFPYGKPFKGFKNKFQKENVNGINVIRIPTFMAKNSGFIKRIFDYASFTISCMLHYKKLPKPDIVIGSSPPLFAAIAAWRISKKHKVPFVFEVRDLWPESISAVGACKSFLLYPFVILAKKMYRDAALIISVTHSYLEKISSLAKISPSKIKIHRNGFDQKAITAAISSKNTVKSKYNIPKNKKIISYIGTVGLAHNILLLIKLSPHLATHHSNWHIVVMGGGAEFENLQIYVKNNNLKNISLIKQSTQTEAIQLLSTSDLSFIHLKQEELFKSVVPSKIYETMALGIPILLGVDGEARQFVQNANAGLYFTPDSLSHLIESFNKFNALPIEQQQKLGTNGKKYIQEFERSKIAKKILDDLTSLNT